MDNLLGLSFTALAALFFVWNVVSIARYLAYRRVKVQSQLTWLPPRPWFYNMCLGIGFFMLSLTVLSILRSSPPLTIVAQVLMAVYYTILFPLSFRIRRGLYRTGIWTERGFVPYARVRTLSWLEKPQVVLVVKTEGALLGGAGYARLVVPGELYGQARRILADHIEDRSLTVEKSILGLSDGDSQAQEQV
jgi:hypothetical protein